MENSAGALGWAFLVTRLFCGQVRSLWSIIRRYAGCAVRLMCGPEKACA